MSDSSIVAFWLTISSSTAFIAVACLVFMCITHRAEERDRRAIEEPVEAEVVYEAVPTPRLPIMKALEDTELIQTVIKAVHITTGGAVRYEYEEGTATGRMRNMMAHMAIKEAVDAGRDPYYVPKHSSELATAA